MQAILPESFASETYSDWKTYLIESGGFGVYATFQSESSLFSKDFVGSSKLKIIF